MAPSADRDRHELPRRRARRQDDPHFMHGISALDEKGIYGYDLFGLGNVLLYIVGKGDVLLQDLAQQDPAAYSRLDAADCNIVFHNRVANLAKVYPYIPEALNRVLLHFSHGAHLYYERVDQVLDDLQSAMAVMPQGSTRPQVI